LYGHLVEHFIGKEL